MTTRRLENPRAAAHIDNTPRGRLLKALNGADTVLLEIREHGRRDGAWEDVEHYAPRIGRVALAALAALPYGSWGQEQAQHANIAMAKCWFEMNRRATVKPGLGASLAARHLGVALMGLREVVEGRPGVVEELLAAWGADPAAPMPR